MSELDHEDLPGEFELFVVIVALIVGMLIAGIVILGTKGCRAAKALFPTRKTQGA